MFSIISYRIEYIFYIVAIVLACKRVIQQPLGEEAHIAWDGTTHNHHHHHQHQSENVTELVLCLKKWWWWWWWVGGWWVVGDR